MRSSIIVSLFLVVSSYSFGQSELGNQIWEWNTDSVKKACVSFVAVSPRLDNDLCSTPLPSPIDDPAREPIVLVVSVDKFNDHQAPPGEMQMAFVFHNQHDVTSLSTWQQPWHAKYQLSSHSWNSGRAIEDGAVAGPYPIDTIKDWERWRQMWNMDSLETWDTSTLSDSIQDDISTAIEIIDYDGTVETVKLMFTGENRGGFILQRDGIDIVEGDFLIPNYPQEELPVSFR